VRECRKNGHKVRVEWGVREIRRPKSEIRKKPETRNPSQSTLRRSARADSDLGPPATGEGAAFEKRERCPTLAGTVFIPTYSLLGEELAWLNGPPSVFGLRISFGFRASDFGLCHKFVSTQNSEEPFSLNQLQQVRRYL
jgi:hypothetical protein